MLYPPNTMHWERGSIVIHHADAKEPKMLMRVIGRTRAGLVKTQYIDKRHKRTVWVNDLKNLLDPRDFSLLAQDFAQDYLERYQSDFERVRRWNRNHPDIGVPVLVPTSHAGPSRLYLHSGLWAWRRGYVGFAGGCRCLR
jgi:hypothetical protein